MRLRSALNHALLSAAVALASSAIGAAQAATPNRPLPSAAPQRAPLEWDTVSIHPHDPNDSNWNSNEQPSGIKLDGITVSAMLSEAYNWGVAEMRPEDVIGLPDWARKNHYDVIARVAPEDAATYKKLTDLPMTEEIKAIVNRQVTPDTLMLRNILEDRFHLKLHYEERERPVYNLFVDKGGPKLKQASDLNHGTLQYNSGVFKAEGVPTLFLASVLGMPLQRTVIDRTGLTGNYDFSVHFLPEGEQAKPDNDYPDLFTALREQLGLRLESGKAPVLVLVIEHIDPPSPN